MFQEEPFDGASKYKNINSFFMRLAYTQKKLSFAEKYLYTGGVDTAAVGSTFDISNADRLGISEVELVQLVVDGVNHLIKIEKRLEKNQKIDDLIPCL
jgi:protein-arginine kinase